MKIRLIILGSLISLSTLIISFLPLYLNGIAANTMFQLRTIFYCILLPFLSAYCQYIIERTGKINLKNGFSWIFSFIFSQFIVLGAPYYLIEQISYFDLLTLNVGLWLIGTLLWMIIFYPILQFLLSWFQNYKLKSPKKFSKYRNIRIFLCCVFVRLLCFLCFYPIIFDFDAALGLRTMIQPGEVISNHHPFFVQWLHASFYRLGNVIGRPDIGMALLTIIWIFLSSLIIIEILKIISRLNIGIKSLNLIGFTFAFFPLFPYLSLLCTKDGLFAYLFLYYIALLIEWIQSRGSCLRSVSYIVLFILISSLLCLTRHQGIYIILCQGLVMLYTYRKSIIKSLVVTLTPCIIFFSFTNFYLPSINIEPTNKKEAYNMLFQQSAAFLKQYPEEVSPQNLKAINDILNTDSITNAYNPRITDNVKSYYRFSEGNDTIDDGLIHFRNVDHRGENELLAQYRKAWINMGLTHPSSYFNTTMIVVSPYFFNNGLNLFSLDYSWQNSAAMTPVYSFYVFKPFYNVCNKFLGFLSNLPLFDLFFGIPYYNWLALFFIGLLVYRKDKNGLIIFLPVILSLGLLWISPVASGRYEFPIIMILPLLFIYILKTNNINGQKESRDSNSLL